MHKSIAVDLALITSDDEVRRDGELTLLNTARHHDANMRSLLQTVPGIGKRLSRVWLYDSHDLHRCPRVQDCISYGRLVKCRKESAGKRLGTSGATSGHAPLKWAFSEAAVWFLRDPPAAQRSLARLERTHDNGQAFTILAQTLARAVYDRLTRKVACDQETFFPPYPRGEGSG